MVKTLMRLPLFPPVVVQFAGPVIGSDLAFEVLEEFWHEHRRFAVFADHHVRHAAPASGRTQSNLSLTRARKETKPIVPLVNPLQAC